MILFPNAKINIGLNVVSKRADGYHNLETIFYPVQLKDGLELVKSDHTQFTTSGIKIDGKPENNLVYKAYQLLHNEFNLPPVHLHLHKVIPFGAGLGGGSADASFTLKLINDFFNLKLSVKKLELYASKIGADCPFFINNTPTVATGIGDQFQPVQLDLSNFKIVIIKPDVSVSTPDAYRHIVPGPSEFNLLDIEKLAIEDWKGRIENDFEKSVFQKYPEIETLKNKLYELGALYASMSGSGSAVFGIFDFIPSEIHEMNKKHTFIC